MKGLERWSETYEDHEKPSFSTRNVSPEIPIIVQNACWLNVTILPLTVLLFSVGDSQSGGVDMISKF